MPSVGSRGKLTLQAAKQPTDRKAIQMTRLRAVPAARTRAHPSNGLIRMSDVQEEKVKWLWPHYLPRGMVVIMEGDPGVGKSTVTLDWIARITSGAKWPDGAKGIRPANAIILSAEDSTSATIKPRLLAAGADPTRVYQWKENLSATEEEDGPTLSKAGVAALRQRIVSTKAAIVVVDVLMAFMENDAYRDQAVRKMLSPLTRMAEETGCTIVLIRHLTKTKNKNSKYRGSGSIGILGGARMSYVVTEDPDTGLTYFYVGKNNIGPKPPGFILHLEDVPEYEQPRVEWEVPKPLTLPSLADLGFDEKAEPKLTKEEEAERKLVWLFRNQSVGRRLLRSLAVKETMSRADCKKDSVYRAKDALGIRRVDDDSDGFTYWEWPQGVDYPEYHDDKQG